MRIDVKYFEYSIILPCISSIWVGNKNHIGVVYTIIFKSVGTDDPNTNYLRKRYSPSPPIQCWIALSILF